MKLLLLKYWKQIGVVITIILTALGIYVKGSKDNQVKNDLQDKEEFIETRKRIDNAVKDSPTDADAAREWLRDRKSK